MLVNADLDVGVVSGGYGSALDVATSNAHLNVVKRPRNAESEWEE